MPRELDEGVRRNRTTHKDLAYLVQVLVELERRPGEVQSRVELSVRDDETVVAQVITHTVAVPLVGHGDNAPEALRDLRDEITRVATKRKRRKQQRAQRAAS